MPRPLILLGITLVVLGLPWGPLSRLGLARPPGDIVLEREGFRLRIPITSAILVSVLLSAIVALVRAIPVSIPAPRHHKHGKGRAKAARP